MASDPRHPLLADTSSLIAVANTDQWDVLTESLALTTTYDASYYETQLIRAVESVLSPLGWDRTDIRRELSALEDTTLSSFGSTSELS